MIEIVSVLAFVVVVAVVFAAVQYHRASDLKKKVAIQSEKNYVDALSLSKKHFNDEIAQLGAGTQPIDSHTQLLTKQAFTSQLDQLTNRSKKASNLFALVMIKLIPSKAMATQNQSITSAIIVEAAHRIKTTIRDADIACYYEKEKFLVLFTKMIKPEVVVHGVERIINELHRPYINKADHVAAEVNVHAGITIYPFDGEDPATLLSNATETLDKIKMDKENLFQFFQEETQALGERELILKDALKSPDLLNHIVFEYRPYYDIQTDDVVCIHVVASLQHPELGTIPYDEFLRFAHYSSRLFELYEWMMESAILKFSKSSEIKSNPKRFIFSFNLQQFSIPNFLDKIITIIKNLSTSENEIIMEIEDEENLDNAHLDPFKNAIERLNQSHIPITIGILVLGHFALNKLNKVQFRYLKIDKKLVNDLGKRPESVAILEQIMMLAFVMQIETLTTGVNTQEQKTILENLGCKIIQGNFYDKKKKESLFIESELVK